MSISIYIQRNENGTQMTVNNPNHPDSELKKNKNSQGGSSVFAGNLNMHQDKIAMKKQEAMKRAMNLVMDAFSGEKKIDADVGELRQKAADAKEEMTAAQKELDSYTQKKEDLREEYGITADSQEQKDLELLEKRYDSERIGSDITLTDEEKARLKEIDEAPMTEYQERAMGYHKAMEPYRQQKENSQNTIAAISSSIKDISLERLKSSPMVGAIKQKDELLKAVSKEIVGILYQDAIDHLEEEKEKVLEEAEKKAEEKKEEEELKEEKAEEEKQGEEIKENTENFIEMDDIQETIKQNLKKITDELDLLEEDIKGILVNINI